MNCTDIKKENIIYTQDDIEEHLENINNIPISINFNPFTLSRIVLPTYNNIHYKSRYNFTHKKIDEKIKKRQNAIAISRTTNQKRS